jgi:glycogenin glucosyltransferase
MEIQELVEEPEMKPIFPWEKKPRQTSRVFVDEIPAPEDDDYEGSQATEDVLDDQAQGTDTGEWKDYTQESRWDSVPEIQEYVSGLKHHRTHNSQPAEPSPRIVGKYDSKVVVDERPSLPVTPAPIRRTGPHWLSAEEGKFPSAAGIPSQEDWDPHAKLEELRGLPPAFIANILAKGTSTNGTQTDSGNTVDINRAEEPQEKPEDKPEERPEDKPIERQPSPVIYSTQIAQTESPQVKDSGTQWENEDWDEETVAPSTAAPSTTSSQPQTPTQELPVMKLQPVPAPVAKKASGRKSKEILQETVLNKSPESKEKRKYSLRKLFPRIRRGSLNQTVEVR